MRSGCCAAHGRRALLWSTLLSPACTKPRQPANEIYCRAAVSNKGDVFTHPIDSMLLNPSAAEIRRGTSDTHLRRRSASPPGCAPPHFRTQWSASGPAHHSSPRQAHGLLLLASVRIVVAEASSDQSALIELRRKPHDLPIGRWGDQSGAGIGPISHTPDKILS